MSLNFISNKFHSEKAHNFFERLKYFTSPTIYKILYDKYSRPDIYRSICELKISEINTLDTDFKKSVIKNFSNMNKTLDENFYSQYKYNDKNSQSNPPEALTSNNQSLLTTTNYQNYTNSFPELIVLSYYNQLFQEKSFIAALSLITLGQFTLSKVLNINWDRKKFIFLDNNRAIFNKIIKANVGLANLTQLSFYLTLSALLYFTSKMIYRNLYDKLEEEEMIKDKYKRSLILYQQLLY